MQNISQTSSRLLPSVSPDAITSQPRTLYVQINIANYSRLRRQLSYYAFYAPNSQSRKPHIVKSETGVTFLDFIDASCVRVCADFDVEICTITIIIPLMILPSVTLAPRLAVDDRISRILHHNQLGQRRKLYRGLKKEGGKNRIDICREHAV